MNYLLAHAIPDAGVNNESLPNTSSPREWTFRDILQMPKKLQEEWKNTCREELEALCKRQVFKLTELPPGHKTIRNHWLFGIKTDYRKKARLVAKGCSHLPLFSNGISQA